MARLCDAVPYVSTASVALGWQRRDVAHPLAGSGFVVARRHSDAAHHGVHVGVVEVGPPRPAGSVLLRAFLGGAHDPGVVDLDDEGLIDMAVRDLAPRPRHPAAPLLTRVFRWPNAGAQHNVGHLARIAAIGGGSPLLPGLFVAGSGFESIGIPDCVADGRRIGGAAADYVRMGS